MTRSPIELFWTAKNHSVLSFPAVKRILTSDEQTEGEAGVEEVGWVARVGGGQGPHGQSKVHPWLCWKMLRRVFISKNVRRGMV